MLHQNDDFGLELPVADTIFDVVVVAVARQDIRVRSAPRSMG